MTLIDKSKLSDISTLIQWSQCEDSDGISWGMHEQHFFDTLPKEGYIAQTFKYVYHALNIEKETLLVGPPPQIVFTLARLSQSLDLFELFREHLIRKQYPISGIDVLNAENTDEWSVITDSVSLSGLAHRGFSFAHYYITNLPKKELACFLFKTNEKPVLAKTFYQFDVGNKYATLETRFYLTLPEDIEIKAISPFVDDEDYKRYIGVISSHAN